MKTIFKSMMNIGIMLTLFIGLNACAKENDDANYNESESIIDVAADGTTLLIKSSMENVLSEDFAFDEVELSTLLHMKEEEKLAMDVYTALYAKWGRPVFLNISKAEKTHMNAVIYLLQNYGVDYTQTGIEGEYTIPEFNTLYSELVTRGSVSIAEALKIGALIEEMDIKDLIESIGKVTNENIILVFENLQRGSRNHLRAFNRQLGWLDMNYTPVYLSQSAYDQIVSSPNETGNQYPTYPGSVNCIRN